jgi:hypothetical protein
VGRVGVLEDGVEALQLNHHRGTETSTKVGGASAEETKVGGPHELGAVLGSRGLNPSRGISK